MSYLGCIFLVAVLAACSPAAPNESEQPSATPRSPDEAPLSAVADDSLDLRLHLPDRVAPGEPVPITFRVENATDRSLDLYLTGRPIAFDLIVTAEDGRTVWRRLEDETIPMVLRIQSLAPGETLELGETWDQRSNAGEFVPPGTYTVRGKLLTEDEPLVTPESRLRIGPS